MRGKVVVGSLALLLAVAAPAAAQEGHRDITLEPGKALMEVKVPNQNLYDMLYSSYDFVEAMQRNGDGSVSTDVLVNAEEEAALRARGVQFLRTLETDAATDRREVERDAALAREDRAHELAESGSAAGGRSQSAIPQPGEVTIMRAYTFTNYAGRFLYVEAHTKAATPVTPNGVEGSPTMALSFAGADGVFGPASNMPINRDTQTGLPNNNVYQFHRHLVRVTDVEPTRVRVASSAGGVDEAAVSEWVGSTRPPHAAGYLRGFFNSYMDPTQITDRFVSLASEFSNIAEIVSLPNLTHGYRRKAQTVMGVPFGAPYAGQSGSFANANAQQAVILESLAYGHEGGNDLFATFNNPGVPDSPLTVSVNGNDLVVDLATDASGALSSTAAQVVNAINANAAAAAMLKSYRYRGFAVAGTGIAQATPRSRLSDFLNAPAHVQRAPFQVKMLRIGKQRDGSKVGVFIYCQQHAREWVTPITCLETAERLLRNYAIDAQTKELLDNLDVFIVPSVNPDGAHYSMYDNNNQRRNLVNHCLPDTFQDPLARHFIGVDLNRNNTVGTFFDGYAGAAGVNAANPATFNQCTSDVYAGPFEASEAEIRNEHWVVDTFSNIKFAINIHTYGGYFMWAPGAYIANGRVTLPAPNIGIERYFFDVADTILARIKEHRNTIIEPERTGPIADVLYSAAGNSADDQYYRKGIISYSFEAGSRIFAVNQQTGEITRTDVAGGGFEGFRPPFETEGRHEAFEFADGNFGLLESALAYSRDLTPPAVNLDSDGVTRATAPPINFRFTWPGEAAVIHYTTDGSTPTLASPKYENQGPRRPGQILSLDRLGVHDVKWIAVDIKGNVSPVQTQRFLIGPEATVGGTVPPTLSLTLGAPATFGAFTPGVGRDYLATTSANVISTAGEATLSVTDPDTANTGRLVNGAFALPRVLQANANGGTFAPVGGTSSPTTVLTYPGPVSNDAVSLGFKQTIGANDALRTGTYSKTLTFTLSTNSP
jgi:Zinc carboxypeptidase/Chitobiase/beta-hexosaminidase C-terminal domain